MKEWMKRFKAKYVIITGSIIALVEAIYYVATGEEFTSSAWAAIKSFLEF